MTPAQEAHIHRQKEAAIPRLNAIAEALERGDKWEVIKREHRVSGMTIGKALRRAQAQGRLQRNGLAQVNAARRKLSEARYREILAMLDAGKTWDDVEHEANCGRATIHRALRFRREGR